MIEFRKAKKQYNNFSLDMDLKVNKGEILLLVGRNASGKTTSFKFLLGVNEIEDGTLLLNGEDIEKFDKNKIGLVLSDSFFPSSFKAKEIAKVLKSSYRDFDVNLFYEYLKKFDLPCNERIKNFSLGMLAKLKMISAICHNPEILILDEPTLGLDLIARDEIMDLIRNFMDDDKTIIISSHLTSDFEKICDRVAFIDKGRIIYEVDMDFIDSSLAIVKSDNKFLNIVDKDDLLSVKKKDFVTIYLVKNREKYMNKNLLMEKASLDDLIRSVYMKGEEI